MRYALILIVASVLLAGCGGSSRPSRQVTLTATTTTTTTTAATSTAGPEPGYLNATTLKQALLGVYNSEPPYSAHASSDACTVNVQTFTATCTMYLTDGRRAVEPVAIASDGSNYQAGPGVRASGGPDYQPDTR
jgi:hypothetical protein